MHARVMERAQGIVQRVVSQAGMPGAGVVVYDGTSTAVATAGVLDLSTSARMCSEARFDAGHLTALLMAIVAHELAGRGELDIEAPLERYLPELRGDDKGRRINLKHLLSHTAGYQSENLSDPDVVMGYSWEEFVAFFRRTPMLFEPGSVFNHVLSHTALLGRVLSKVTGLSVPALLREMLLDPLGIERDEPEPPPERLVAHHVSGPKPRTFAKLAATQWSEFWRDILPGPKLSLAELTRIGATLIDAGSDEARIISAATSLRLRQQVVALPRFAFGGMREEIALSHGLGLSRFLEGRFGLSSTMGGQSIAIRMDLDRRLVVAVGLACNQPAVRDLILNSVLAAIDTATIRSDAHIDLSELAGSYHGARHATFEATIEGNRLALRAGHSPFASPVARNQALILVKNEKNRMVPQSELGLAIGFFREPSGSVCLMVGNTVYKKTGANGAS